MQPQWPNSALARSDLMACREKLRAGSKSFSGASTLLPKSVRDAVTVLYAFCREADDAIDIDAGGANAIARLRERLDRAYSRRPFAQPVDRALSAVVDRYAIPRTLFDALLEGFEWDASGRRYDTLAEVLQYAARVAGTIGAMMALLMGVRSTRAVAKACDLGMAMQLTNIARDVGEDARAGRLYLPLNSLRHVGIDPERWLADPQMSPALRIVIDNLLYEADYLYSGVEAGIAELPRSCQAGITAARLIYADIGRVVRAAGCDSVSRRAVVSGRRKCQLLVKSYFTVARVDPQETVSARPATQYLLKSIESSPDRVMPTHTTIPWWRFKSRALWMIDLFDRLERRGRFENPIESDGAGALGSN